MTAENKETNLARVERLIEDAKTWACICAIFSFMGLIAMFWAISMQEQFGEGSWNAISFSLGLLQTMLAVIAFGGFWMVKGAATEAAREVAEKCANKVTTKHLDEKLIDQVQNSLTKLFDTEQGAKLLVTAVVEPSVAAVIAAAIEEAGLDEDMSRVSPIENPRPSLEPAPSLTDDEAPSNNKLPSKTRYLNELHTDFWFGISEEQKKRFLKPYQEPPFEE